MQAPREYYRDDYLSLQKVYKVGTQLYIENGSDINNYNYIVRRTNTNVSYGICANLTGTAYSESFLNIPRRSTQFIDLEDMLHKKTYHNYVEFTSRTQTLKFYFRGH
jgi:hypothetical protein